MRIHHLTISVCAFALSSTLIPTLVHASNEDAVQVSTNSKDAAQQAFPVLLALLPVQEPLESFWDELAKCETGGNWKNGGNWAGGLGIAKSTWYGFGGHEFSSTPAKATREEQLIIANRIAVHGYQTKDRFRTLADRPNNPMFQNAVGFGGWGALECAGGKPHLMKYEPQTVVAQKFKWGQKGRLVKDLQAIIGVSTTAVYDERTWAAHQAYVIKHNIDRSNVPRHRMKRASSVPDGDVKKCKQYSDMAYDAGFPKQEIETVTYVVWKESRCVSTAFNAKDEHGGSFGLMQVNKGWVRKLVRQGIIKSQNDLFIPETNFRAAFYVWTKSIESVRYGWRPWSIK